jgi:hypothetical protein
MSSLLQPEVMCVVSNYEGNRLNTNSFVSCKLVYSEILFAGGRTS